NLVRRDPQHQKFLSPFRQNATATFSVVLRERGAAAELGYPLRGRLLPRLWSAAASFRFSRSAFFRLRSLRQRLIDLEPRPIEMSLTTNSTTSTPQPSRSNPIGLRTAQRRRARNAKARRPCAPRPSTGRLSHGYPIALNLNC